VGRFIFGGAPFQPPDGVTITYNDTNQIQTSGTLPGIINGDGVILKWEGIIGSWNMDIGWYSGSSLQGQIAGVYTTGGVLTSYFSIELIAGGTTMLTVKNGLQAGVTVTTVTTMNNTLDDGSGNMITAGYAYIKGKNRLYQQNLTASTTTATTATLLGTSMAVTPKFSGYLVINATIRANNNTLSDGVTVSIYQGASSGALTTLLDSDTYTQEGLASNSETLSLHYELSGQTVGTATYISLAFNAVTGGTASAKIVNFAVQEI